MLLKSSFFCTYFRRSKLLFDGFAVSQITLRLEQCLAYSSVLTFLYSLQIESFTPYMKKAFASQTALDLFCCFFPSWLCGHSGDTVCIYKRDIVHSHWCYRTYVLCAYLSILHIVDMLHVFVYMLCTFYLHFILDRLQIVCMLSTAWLQIFYGVLLYYLQTVYRSYQTYVLYFMSVFMYT